MLQREDSIRAGAFAESTNASFPFFVCFIIPSYEALQLLVDQQTYPDFSHSVV